MHQMNSIPDFFFETVIPIQNGSTNLRKTLILYAKK